MENGDEPAAAPDAQAHEQGLQQQVYFLQQQLQAQHNLFMQQQQFLAFQQQHQQGQPRPRVAEPHKIKLATIWSNQVRSWFALAESQFNMYAVMDPRQRFDLVVAALSDDARLHAKAVVESPEMYRDPYLALRARLTCYLVVEDHRRLCRCCGPVWASWVRVHIWFTRPTSLVTSFPLPVLTDFF